MPDDDQEAPEHIDATNAFGAPSKLGREANDRLDDLSGVPKGYPSGKSEADNRLEDILKGDIPKSGS